LGKGGNKGRGVLDRGALKGRENQRKKKKTRFEKIKEQRRGKGGRNGTWEKETLRYGNKTGGGYTSAGNQKKRMGFWGMEPSVFGGGNIFTQGGGKKTALGGGGTHFKNEKFIEKSKEKTGNRFVRVDAMTGPLGGYLGGGPKA